MSTARWGYVRLREERYTDAKLKKWIQKLKAQYWNEAFVFFKHEDAGAAPKLAARFIQLAGDGETESPDKVRGAARSRR